MGVSPPTEDAHRTRKPRSGDRTFGVMRRGYADSSPSPLRGFTIRVRRLTDGLTPGAILHRRCAADANQGDTERQAHVHCLFHHHYSARRDGNLC